MWCFNATIKHKGLNLKTELSLFEEQNEILLYAPVLRYHCCEAMLIKTALNQKDYYTKSISYIAKMQ